MRRVTVTLAVLFIAGIVGVGGDLYYRLNEDWFGIAMLSVERNTTRLAGAMADDPAITGLTGFLRIAYRF